MRRVVKNATVAKERYRVGLATDSPPARRGEISERAGEAHEAPATELIADPGAGLEAAKEQALTLLQEAQERALAIVDEGQARAEQMIDEAAAVVATLREQARATGRDAGYAAGRAAAEAEMLEDAQRLRALVEAARGERHAVVASAEEEIVRLAMAVATRVVHREIETNPRVVLDVARSAIARLSDKETLVVRVNPADLETLRAGREELFPGDARQIRFVGDLRVDRGGVVVDTEAGSVDGKIEHQLMEARKLLRLDEDEVTLDRQVSSSGVVGHAEAS